MGLISRQKLEKRTLRSLKECKRTMRSERKRMWCPTLAFVNSKVQCEKTQNYIIDISKMVRDIKKFKASPTVCSAKKIVYQINSYIP